MRVADALPTTDALQHPEGVHQALRQGQRIGALGWVVLFLSLAQLVPAILSDQVRDAGGPVWIGLALLLVAIVLVAYRLGASCSLAADNRAERGLPWLLAADLTQTLSARIQRLWLLEHEKLAEPRPDRRDRPHIHVSGVYVFRKRGEVAEAARLQIEATPWGCSGSPDHPAELAHPVKFDS